MNPELLHALLENGVDRDTQHTRAVLLGFGVTGISAWDVIDGWLMKRRDERRTAVGA